MGAVAASARVPGPQHDGRTVAAVPGLGQRQCGPLERKLGTYLHREHAASQELG
jgi:hypothetical protein